MPEYLTPQEHAAAQARNYGEYIAASFIYVNGALAYAPGHAVSSASVEDGTVDRSQVIRVDELPTAAPAPAPAPLPEPSAPSTSAPTS